MPTTIPSPLRLSLVAILSGCGSTDAGGTAQDNSGTSSTQGTATQGTEATGIPSTSGTSIDPDTGTDTTASADGTTTSDGTDSSTEGSSSGGGEVSCPATVLPGLVPGVEPESHSHHPPVADDNGNLYRMTETPADDGNNPQMLKSSDGGASWTEVDAGNRPDANDLEGTYQLQVGTTIFFSVTRGPRAWWFAFNTSDAARNPDTWIDTEMFDDDLTSGGVDQASSLAQTSDGQFWLAYSDIVINDRQQIALRRRTGPDAYGPKVTIDTTSGSWTGPRLVLGRDDITHLFYNDALDSRLYWRTIAPDGAVSDRTRIDTDGTAGVAIPHAHTVIYDRDGAEVMVTGFGGTDDRLKAVTIVDGVVGSEEAVSDDPVLQNPPVVRNEGAVAHLSLHGTTVHAVWTDDDTGDLLHRAKPDLGDWGPTETLWDSQEQTALYIYCAVLTSGNCPRLGCTYDVGPHVDDAGAIEYDEFLLAE